MVRIRSDIEQFCNAEETKDQAGAIMSVLLDNIRDIDNHLSKRTFYAAVLIGGFEFIKRASVGQITVLGIQFTEFSMVEKILPVLIAYLYFSCWAHIANRRLLEELYNNFVRCIYPTLGKNDLDVYLRPPNFVKTYDIIARESKGISRILIDVSVLPVVLSLILSVPVFTAYAIHSLLSKYGSDDLLALASSGLSVFFIFQAFLLIVTVNNATVPHVIKQGPAAETGEGGGESASRQP